MECKSFKEFILKYKIWILSFISLVIIIVVCLILSSNYRKNDDNSKPTTSKSNLITKTFDDKNLFESYIEEIKTKYPSNYSLNKAIKYNEYKLNDVNEISTLIVGNSHYSSSNEIKEPIFVFIPLLKTDKMDDEFYYNVNLDCLKSYCFKNNLDIYVISLPFLTTQSQEEEKANDKSKLIQQPQQNNIKETKLTNLDDLFLNEDFLSIKDKIAIGDIADLNNKPLILFIKDSQDNKISETPDNERSVIFVELSEDEKKQYSTFKWNEKKDFIQQHLNLNIDCASINDIKKLKNRKIFIWYIKNYDYEDKTNNPNSESQLQ